MNTIITSPYKPAAEIQTEEGLKNYLSKLTSLDHSEDCIELSNVLAAKHNLTMIPSGMNDFFENQNMVTDLTDKAALICCLVLGRDRVLGYCDGSDLRPFNQLVNEIDEAVAQQDLEPEQHGQALLSALNDRI